MVLLLLAVLTQIQVRTDMLAFLPAGGSPAARMVLQEAREGSATGLILVGIDGAPVPDLARISRTVATALGQSRLFAVVAGGQAALSEQDEAMLFAHRYLLSPATTPAAFTAPALHADLEGVLRQLRSSAAPLAVRYGLADPPGAFLAAIRGWMGSGDVRSIDGAWFAADRDRALLLVRTRAGGMDVPAQEIATAAIERAFTAASPGGARLVITGPAVFARDAARAIRGDVHRISVVSTILVVLLLWWRFRSPLVIAAIAVPVVLSVAAAALVVQLVYGSVHGVALGFGITMLGVSLDYPVLMIGHRKSGEPAPATRERIGPAFILAVITATLGLAAMVFSGFPGLSQLGVFSAVGLATAALATWWLLPRLVVAANLAPVAPGSAAWLGRIERLRRWRLLGLLPVLLAAVWLMARGGPNWEDDLESLSPVPAASRALDAELRRNLGAPDVGQLIVVRGADAQTVLRQQEALIPLLDRLQADGLIGGAALAARLLPSAATQEARRNALPDPDELVRRLEAARAGLPFRPTAFDAFVDAVRASRSMQPLVPSDLVGTPFADRLAPLMFERDGMWQGPIALQSVRDPTHLATALADAGIANAYGATNGGATLEQAARGGPAVARPAVGGPVVEGAIYVDMRTEIGRILSGYTARAWRWLGWSGLMVLAALAVGLRSPAQVLRVLGAVAAAMLVTVAVLTLLGTRLSLIHLVALQLVAGVGLDYALFFARRQLDTEERARTLRTLVTCNAMTLLTFGMLAACQTPLLRDIGVTVALGAVLAMLFAFLFAGVRPSEASSHAGSNERPG
ncbi:MAG TPA: MMPL family transporter [Acetobacteraceae bacterium]|nr:MMPL family transporter [Acetobacteraceae bacterium]